NNVNRSSGTFTGSANSSLVITGNAGSIDVYMTQTSSQTRSLKDLTVTRSNSINLNDTLELKGHLSLTNNTILNSNGKLYLISNSEGTASVGNLSNATINGDVIAQRFVPGGNAKRRWRL